jgi:hypothetical protein
MLQKLTDSVDQNVLVPDGRYAIGAGLDRDVHAIGLIATNLAVRFFRQLMTLLFMSDFVKFSTGKANH